LRAACARPTRYNRNTITDSCNNYVARRCHFPIRYAPQLCAQRAPPCVRGCDETVPSLQSLWRAFRHGDASLWATKFCRRACKAAYLRELALDRDTIRRWFGLPHGDRSLTAVYRQTFSIFNRAQGLSEVLKTESVMPAASFSLHGPRAGH
jgi:hypothetical protein